MRIYIDLFFLFNTIMDVIIILGVGSLLKRRTNIIRVVIASLLGGIISLLIFFDINKILLELGGVILISIISFGYRDIRYLFKNIIYMYIISVLLGGIIYLFNIRVCNSIFLNYLIMIIISIETTILYVKESKKIKNNYNNYYKVNIYFKDKSLSLIGFMDTGNNLYDPYKHRPIILVNKKYERDNFILVPYNTLSGSGLLKCIRPEYIEIEGIGYKSNLLVGFSDSVKLIDGVDVILHKDLMKG